MPTTPPTSRARRTRSWRLALSAAGGLMLAVGGPGVSAADAPDAADAATGGAPAVANAAAVACANTSLVPSAHDTAEISGAILCLINAARDQHGLAPLIPIRALNQSAMGHSHDMVLHDYFSHTSPSGHTPAQRMRHDGAPCADGCALGENIAWASGPDSTPAAIVQAWMSSSGHRANILDPTFRYEGLGVAEGSPAMLSNGQNGTTVTQDFDS